MENSSCGDGHAIDEIARKLLLFLSRSDIHFPLDVDTAERMFISSGACGLQLPSRECFESAITQLLEKGQIIVDHISFSDADAGCVAVIFDVTAASGRKHLRSESSFGAVSIQQILDRPTTHRLRQAAPFAERSLTFHEYCQAATRTDCHTPACPKLHFQRILYPQTDLTLGDCSFLDTCRHRTSCKFVHYDVDQVELQNDQNRVQQSRKFLRGRGRECIPRSPSVCVHAVFGRSHLFQAPLPAQWIECDISHLDMSILGKFSVIMADPPWDIHMELPYGTMTDDAMLALDIASLQDDGFLLLWVTGRAMELGRRCLGQWGYRRVDEIVWIKINQLQRIIRTGRTGHWLNHSKEHCLVGVKGTPRAYRHLDCDVIVAEVRETSRKPDEIYDIAERLCPSSRKIELFGRPHNIRPGWLTLGNQLPGVALAEPALVEAFKRRYPTIPVKSPSISLQVEISSDDKTGESQ